MIFHVTLNRISRSSSEELPMISFICEKIRLPDCNFIVVSAHITYLKQKEINNSVSIIFLLFSLVQQSIWFLGSKGKKWIPNLILHHLSPKLLKVHPTNPQQSTLTRWFVLSISSIEPLPTSLYHVCTSVCNKNILNLNFMNNVSMYSQARFF